MILFIMFCILNLITILVFVLRHGVKKFHSVCSVICQLSHQIVCVRNFIHLFENVRNFVRNCPKFLIMSSQNFCPKIKCPKIKRPKILEINVLSMDTCKIAFTSISNVHFK